MLMVPLPLSVVGFSSWLGSSSPRFGRVAEGGVGFRGCQPYLDSAQALAALIFEPRVTRRKRYRAQPQTRTLQWIYPESLKDL